MSCYYRARKALICHAIIEQGRRLDMQGDARMPSLSGHINALLELVLLTLANLWGPENCLPVGHALESLVGVAVVG